MSVNRWNWLRFAGVALIGLIVITSLMPARWETFRSGHWLIEHFLAYFVVTVLFCLAWPRPFIIAAALMAAAGAIEALQGLTADRIPDLATAFCGAAGVLAAALVVSLVTDLWQKRRVDGGAPSG